MIHVDKLYNINDGVMDAAKWQAMDTIYRGLPSFIDYIDGVPHWFGNSTSLYLYASVEMPGLQVAGNLAEADWIEWEQKFVALTSAALGFEVRSLNG